MVRARSGFCDAEGFALDVDTSGLVTTLVVEVLEVEGSGMFPSTATQSGLSRYFPGTSGAGRWKAES